jgi:FtsH-binding integral membrane protein
LLPKTERRMRYAYLTTLVSLVLTAIGTAYTGVSSFLFGQAPRSQPPASLGNFTGAGQFGDFAGGPQFGNMNLYGGVAHSLTMIAVIIAIVGVLWLGLSLRKLHFELREGGNAATMHRT